MLRFHFWGFAILWMLVVGIWNFSSPAAESPFTLSWTNNLLTICNADFPGGKLDIWYLEAFCRKGSTHQDWGKTKIPHKTRLTSASPSHLEFETKVEPDVRVIHSVTAEPDAVEFVYSFSNQSTQAVDLEWFQ